MCSTVRSKFSKLVISDKNNLKVPLNFSASFLELWDYFLAEHWFVELVRSLRCLSLSLFAGYRTRSRRLVWKTTQTLHCKLHRKVLATWASLWSSKSLCEFLNFPPRKSLWANFLSPKSIGNFALGVIASINPPHFCQSIFLAKSPGSKYSESKFNVSQSSFLQQMQR